MAPDQSNRSNRPNRPNRLDRSGRSSSRGVEVTDIDAGTNAYNAGVRAGDRLVGINGNAVRDVIDYMYERCGERFDLEFAPHDGGPPILLNLQPWEPVGIELSPPKTKTCRNKCIFCFVAQMPRGLRKTLYVKDEDYRLSFLFGNYVTLSNLADADRARILEQHLSPLYISVHSIDMEKRKILLGRPDPVDVLSEIKNFVRAGIRVHAQIVMCPGINDGADLEKTINALARLHPGVESLAVVPVGLTRFHKGGLKPVDEELARSTVRQIERLQRKFIQRFNDPFVHASDEFFLKAGITVPPVEIYGEFPQIENGVGLVRDFLDRFDAIKLPKRLRRAAGVMTFTGSSFYPVLAELARELEARTAGLRMNVVPIKNDFFGHTVSVTGLITGRDLINQLSARSGPKNERALLIPSVVLRDGDGVFLDDVSVEDVEQALGIPAIVIDPTPNGLIEGIRQATSPLAPLLKERGERSEGEG